MNNRKCSSFDHKELNAISFCVHCKIYMCNKCEKIHSDLFKNHNIYNLNSNLNEIFTGVCQEKNHNYELEFFCKSHNVLCCSSCITKIKDDSHGQHTDCDICLIKDIKEEKKNKLNSNIKYLEELSISLEDSIKQLKNILEKIGTTKEELKLNIQKIFTKIRNTLNNREDELLLEVDKKFDDIFFDDEFIKKCEKLPNQIKSSLEKGKSIDKDWENEKKLNLIINNCINIENNINTINTIGEKLKMNNQSPNLNVIFLPNQEKELNNFLENILHFGKVFYNNCFEDSLILNNNNIYINRLIEWINPSYENTISSQLLLRKSRDGDDYLTFHKLCDKKGPTIVLIKGAEGFIVGGYTPLNWESEGDWKKDNKTFVFNLTNNKIYRKNGELTNSIFCDEEIGPLFNYIGFSENGKKNLSQGDFHIRSDDIYINNFNEIIPNEGKNRLFDVEEVEIYKFE